MNTKKSILAMQVKNLTDSRLMNWWQKIVNIGHHPEMDFNQTKRLQFINITIYFYTICTWFFVPFVVIMGNPIQLISQTGTSLLCPIAFYLTWKRYDSPALVFISLLIATNIVIGGITNHGMGIEFFLIAISINCIGILPDIRQGIVMFIVMMLCYTFIEYFNDIVPDMTNLAQDKRKMIYVLTVVTVFVGCFLIMYYSRNLNDNHQAKIDQQRQEIEHHNREITDSIKYAKRIQTAILPSTQLVKQHLKNSFVLYKPKDIVAGDFYWLAHISLSGGGKAPSSTEGIGEGILFAAADCTGHGVPGAMVSVICNNALNRSVREYGLTTPGKILDKTREIVMQEFEKSEEEVKDGMDISLCALQGNILQWAGANNPLWIIRNNELKEYKANKQAIGKTDNPKPFTTHNIELQKEDTIYIFSDGYQDQFGGEKGKKFKSAKLKELLLSIQKDSMDNQKEKINLVFEEWKGKNEQIDDVCLIGVKI